jgi:hypothetical protein
MQATCDAVPDTKGTRHLAEMLKAAIPVGTKVTGIRVERSAALDRASPSRAPIRR